MSTKYIRVLPKLDTIENWKKHNPILKENELCVVITKRNSCRWKIGDGKTPFKKLKYVKKLSDIKNMLCYAAIPATHESNSELMHIVTNIEMNPSEETQNLALNANGIKNI